MSNALKSVTQRRERGANIEKVESARIWLLLVAIFSGWQAVRFFLLMDDVEDPAVRHVLVILTAIDAASTVLYFIFWKKAQTKPVGACLFALLLFIGGMVIKCLISPKLVLSGLLWKGLALAALARAVTAARALEKDRLLGK